MPQPVHSALSVERLIRRSIHTVVMDQIEDKAHDEGYGWISRRGNRAVGAEGAGDVKMRRSVRPVFIVMEVVYGGKGPALTRLVRVVMVVLAASRRLMRVAMTAPVAAASARRDSSNSSRRLATVRMLVAVSAR